MNFSGKRWMIPDFTIGGGKKSLPGRCEEHSKKFIHKKLVVSSVTLNTNYRYHRIVYLF